MLSLAQVKEVQPGWFSRANKRFFGDVSYRVLQAAKSKQSYLVRSTYAWSDMFGSARKLHYRINLINVETYKIESLVDTVFPDIYAVKRWLKEN